MDIEPPNRPRHNAARRRPRKPGQPKTSRRRRPAPPMVFSSTPKRQGKSYITASDQVFLWFIPVSKPGRSIRGSTYSSTYIFQRAKAGGQFFLEAGAVDILCPCSVLWLYDFYLDLDLTNNLDVVSERRCPRSTG